MAFGTSTHTSLIGRGICEAWGQTTASQPDLSRESSAPHVRPVKASNSLRMRSGGGIAACIMGVDLLGLGFGYKPLVKKSKIIEDSGLTPILGTGLSTLL
eukprot:scaffold67053_cov35-Tisochrysis_lutea.AAC.3